MPTEFLEQYKLQIQKTISADDEAISAVLLALREVPLTLRVVPSAAETAAKTQKIAEQDALDIILVVALLVALTEDRNISSDEAIDLISEFVIKEDDLFLDVNDEKLALLRERLLDLLNNASALRVVYKASKVFEDYERIFFDAKVITDVRPVFDLNVKTGDEVISAVTVTHTIKIEYKDLEGEKEFFVALDSDTLENLYQEIGDALQKVDSVKYMLKNAQIIYIGSGSLPESELKENTN